MRLYGFGPTRSLRVQWALNEIGLAYEFVRVDLPAGEAAAPEFLKLNPAGKLPVLVDGDFVLTESAAIVLYLAEKHPASTLMPRDVRVRADVYRWVMFAMTELEGPLWRIARHTDLYPEDKRLPADIALAREEFLRMADVLERHMAERDHIVGDGVTAADCVIAYLMDWADYESLLDGLPCLRAYLECMYTRPTAPPRIAQAFAGL